MKRVLAVAVTALAVCAEIPRFQPEVPFTPNDREYWADHAEKYTMNGTTLVSAGTFIMLKHIDWDGDGDRDMLSGYMKRIIYSSGQTEGNVAYFENIGSEESPEFAFSEMLDIVVPGA